MLLFLFVLIPVLIIYLCFLSKDKSVFLISFTGLCTGVLVCILKVFFTFMHRIPEYSFLSNVLYFTLNLYVLPLVLLYGIYFLVTKDTYEFRIKSFLPLTGSFYAVFLPYNVVSTCSSLSSLTFFPLFVKPLLCLSLLIIIQYLLLRFCKNAFEKNILHMIFYIVIIAFVLFIPPFIETMYLLNLLSFVTVLLSCIYFLSAAVFLVIGIISENGFLC